ncbi:MAG TPA: N-6 DNA methylase, partial [Acidimicrobiales bacterium]
MAGVDRRWKAYLAELRTNAPAASRVEVVVGVATAVGRHWGWTPPPALTPAVAGRKVIATVAAVAPPEGLADPGLPGRVLEAWADPVTRQATGAHFTPPEVAARLVGVVGEQVRWASGPTICDPACGGAAFLLAAADALHDAGLSCEVIVRDHLWGVDVDEAAVATTRLSLSLWAAVHGGEAVVADDAHVVVGDGLADRRAAGPGGAFDVVVGNPPFLGQLASATARSSEGTEALKRRFGGAVLPFTDPAWLFLLAALDLVADGGLVALLQPASLLGARDARAVRGAVLERAELVGLWVAAERVFEANVRVCVPLLRRRIPAPSPRPTAAGLTAPKATPTQTPSATVRRWRGRS